MKNNALWMFEMAQLYLFDIGIQDENIVLQLTFLYKCVF